MHSLVNSLRLSQRQRDGGQRPDSGRSNGLAQSVMASMAALTERAVVKVDRAVQSNFAIQDDWLEFVRGLRGQTASHLLNHQAVAEVIVRLYCKGAAEWQAKAAAYAGTGIAGQGGSSNSSTSSGSSATSSRVGTPWGAATTAAAAAAAAPGSSYGNRNPLAVAAAAGAAAAAAAAAAAGAGSTTAAGVSSSSSSSVNGRSIGLAALTDGGGSGGTVFDLLTAHYSQAGKPGGVGGVAAVAAAAAGGGAGAAAAAGGAGAGAAAGGGAAAAYAAHLWKDPSGPVARLLLSCQQYAAADLKVALFCR
jgi:hypothetical protein